MGDPEQSPEQSIEESSEKSPETYPEPLIRYGVESKSIPGDPTGYKAKECGNIAHWGDRERYEVRAFNVLCCGLPA